MRTGAGTPRFSWMFGPGGTNGSVGAAPRLVLVNAHSSEAPCATHLHAYGDCVEPSALFSCAGVIAFAVPVAVSPTHNSMPVSLVCVNAKRVLSGEKPIQPIAGLGGSVTFRSVPSDGLLMSRLRYRTARCRPLVFGLMRTPPMRNIGWASSARDGMLARSSTAIAAPDALSSTVGGGAASSTSTMALGGSR